MKNLDYLETCKCYWDKEWHPEENVYMPDFYQCERCKCLEIDDHFEGVHTVDMFTLGESYYDSDGNLINFKIGE